MLIVGIIAVSIFSHIKKENVGTYEGDTQYQTIVYEGKTYRKNSDIWTMLFLGIDQESGFSDAENPGENGQSDTICLFVFDTVKEEGRILPISRDTMTEIDIYDIKGEKYMTETGQIALQYAYGDGKDKSCRLMAEKISELLFDVEIDNYLAVRMDGIAIAADTIGGVPVTVEEEETEIDERFQKGAKLNLSGKLAEKFVRGREWEDPLGNNRRMERQILFLNSFAKKLREEENSSWIPNIYEALQPYIYTNLRTSDLRKLEKYELLEERLEIPGTVAEDEGYVQFLPDEEKVKELAVRLFYKEVKKDRKVR